MNWNQHVAGAILLAFVGAGVFACTAVAQPAAPIRGSAAAGPSVFFPQKTFEFQAVIDGVKVVHDFVVTNKGSVALLINDVRTG